MLSDRAGEGEVPIPSLLSLAAVHNHLINVGLRTDADLLVETGYAMRAHDFACLVGYSASGIYPYMAHECIRDLCERGELDVDGDTAVANYDRAVTAGITSIMSKMGISHDAGLPFREDFEILGLDDAFVDECFTHTSTRIGGLGVEGVQRELNERYDKAIALDKTPAPDQLPSLGVTSWRPIDGEEHLINPQTIYLLQRAVREGDYGMFKEYSAACHVPGRAVTLRDLLDFAPQESPVPIDEVEPASEIVKRFNTGAMSYGSISKEAHECLAIAMNRLGGKSNTGEGGEDPARETPLPNGDSRCSAIKQVASGRFGVTSRYLSSAIEIQIKMAQGAKPGEGGHLPGKKVYPWIAEVRRSTPGVGLISPPPHHDIYSIEDLAELIFDLKNANPGARVSVKLCALAGVGTIATGVAKGGADKTDHLRPQRRHGRGPARLDLPCGHPVRDWPRRNATDASAQRPAQPCRGGNRRQAHVRARRGHGRAARRRGVRFRHHAARRHGLHDAARLPAGHLPRGCRDAELQAAQLLCRQARIRRELHDVRRRGDARDHGAARLPHG